MCPPGALPGAAGGLQQELGDPDMEDKEVTFPGGRGWGPSGQPPWPAGPPQTEEDVGHLISALAIGL